MANKIIRRQAGFSPAERKPALTVEHINGDATVLRIAEVRTPIIGGVQKPVITFAEFPGYSFWANATMTDYLCARLGDDTDKWVDVRVPLHKIDVENPTTGEMVNRLYVMPPSQWDETIRAFDGESKPAAKKAARKRGNA
jgi:hypothetical protein